MGREGRGARGGSSVKIACLFSPSAGSHILQGKHQITHKLDHHNSNTYILCQNSI